MALSPCSALVDSLGLPCPARHPMLSDRLGELSFISAVRCLLMDPTGIRIFIKFNYYQVVSPCTNLPCVIYYYIEL